MKFDPFKYDEVKPNVELESPQGLLHVMCSESANVYVTCQGVEALAGFGQEVRVQIADAFTFRVEASKGARVFVENPRAVSFAPVGEVFTNIDRKPMESGTMLEVQKSLRAFQLEHRAAMREMKSERKWLERTRRMRDEEAAEPAEAPFAEQETDAPSVDEKAKPEAKPEPKAKAKSEAKPKEDSDDS